jgi:threonine dehydrogenase-like Zn-dependent dehydrogenase
MKKVEMLGPKHSRVIDIPNVQPNDDQVLIKLKYVGVCMSEHYDWSVVKAGQGFGHEPMGVIVEVGKNVTDYQVGDRVGGLWGSTLPGAGGMVQYQVADPRMSTIVKIPDNIRDEDAVLEPLACIVSAVTKAKIGVVGSKVCVVGCGYMGCGAIALLKLRGAYVVAVDIRPESLEDAKRYGADETYTPEEALAKFNPPFEFGKGRGFASNGFACVMEWGETEESLDVAINLTRMCGQLCIGAYHTGGKRLVDVQQLNFKAIECLSTHPREADLSSQGAVNAARLISSGEWKYSHIPVMVYPMNQFDRAQGELPTKYGKYMKALIDMEKEDGEPILK